VTAAVLETVPRYTDFLHPNGGSLVTLSTVSGSCLLLYLCHLNTRRKMSEESVDRGNSRGSVTEKALIYSLTEIETVSENLHMP